MLSPLPYIFAQRGQNKYVDMFLLLEEKTQIQIPQTSCSSVGYLIKPNLEFLFFGGEKSKKKRSIIPVFVKGHNGFTAYSATIS